MNFATATWVDGQPSDSLPLPDRGLDFGDGLFETLLVLQGRCLYPELHWQRLQTGFQALAFPDCLARVRTILESVLTYVEAHQLQRCALRVTVTRGSAPRGYAPPVDASPRIVASLGELPGQTPQMQAAAALHLADWRWSAQPRLAGIKHLNRLEQVMAASEARGSGCDEALMLDQAGAVKSVAAGNVFLVLDGALLTPPLMDCGIAGTRRRLVMEHWAPALGMTVREQQISTAMLGDAAEVFYSNSLQGLRPVASCAGRHWSAHPVCEALYTHYLGEIQ